MGSSTQQTRLITKLMKHEVHQLFMQPTALALLLALWPCNPRPAACQTPDDQVVVHFRAGEEALKRGELTTARDEFRKVLALDPDLAEADVNLGLVYNELGEYSLSASNLSAGLHQRPNLAGPIIVLGIDYLKLEEPEKAIPALERGLRLDPSNLEGHRALSRCYLAQGDFRQTADEYQKMASLDPDRADAWYNLGHDYLNLSARLAFRGSRTYLNSPWGHRFLGDNMFQRGRWRDAAAEYIQAVAIEPGEPGLHVSLGEAYLHEGKLDQAEAEFQQELQRDPQSEPALLGLAETRLVNGNAMAALEVVRKVWEISPEFLALRRAFPTVQISAGAPKALAEGLQSAPAGPAKDFLLAGLYAQAGTAQADEKSNAFQADFRKWEEARSEASGQEGEPNPCNVHRYTDCVRRLESQKPLARSDLLFLGRTQYTLQQYGDAADTLAQLLPATDKVSAEASYWLALSYQALGADCYDRLQESFPTSWRTLELRAEGFNLHDDTSAAIQGYQQALQLRPNEAELHEALGELFLKKKSYDEAQAELEMSLKLDPSRARTLYLLGRLHVQKRENEEAVPYLEKALRYQPDMPEACGMLGTAYVRLGEDAKAIPELERALPIDFYGDLHYQMYVAYRQMGQLQLADKALARSQELRRDSAAEHQAMVIGIDKVE
jgi:tetratricopeptide (TPR) repeat protein